MRSSSFKDILFIAVRTPCIFNVLFSTKSSLHYDVCGGSRLKNRQTAWYGARDFYYKHAHIEIPLGLLRFSLPWAKRLHLCIHIYYQLNGDFNVCERGAFLEAHVLNFSSIAVNKHNPPRRWLVVDFYTTDVIFAFHFLFQLSRRLIISFLTFEMTFFFLCFIFKQ